MTFGLATDRFYTDKTSNQRQQKTEFHNIVLFGRLAEIAGQYLKKGALAMFEGRIQTRDWQDQAGNKRYRTEIVMENMIMLDRAGATGPATRFNNTPMPSEPMGEPVIDIDEPMGGEQNPDEEEIKVENIPF